MVRQMRKAGVALLFGLVASSAAWGVRLQGIVTDADGPVTGAQVHAVGHTVDRPVRAGTETDQDGRYVLVVERSPSRLVVSKQGRPTTIVQVRQGVREVDVQFRRDGYAMTGRVIDDEGNPVPDAWIAITQFDQLGGRPSLRLPGDHRIDALRTTSDPRGEFAIRALPPWKELRIEARKNEFATVIEEFGPQAAMRDPEHSVGVRSEEPVETLRDARLMPGKPVEIVMPREATLHGWVRWRGQPMSGVEGSLGREEEWTSVTDHRGRFHIRRVPPGEVRMTVRTDDAMAPKSAPPTLTLEPGDRIDDIEIEMVRTAVITGTVTRSDTGAPVEGAQVGQSVTSWQRGRATDEGGRYVLYVLPGELDIMFLRARPLVRPSHPPHGPDPRPSTTVTVEEGEVLDEVDFVVEPWLLGEVTFAGRLLLPDGTPAEGAMVELDSSYLGGRVPPEMELEGHKATTDEAGRFELNPRLIRLEEFFLLKMRSADGEYSAARVVPGRGTESLEVTLHEPAQARLRVEPEDETEDGADSVRVTVRVHAPPHVTLHLDVEERVENSEIVLGPLPAHLPLVFRATARGPAGPARIRRWGPMTISLKPGESLELPRLLLVSQEAQAVTQSGIVEEN